jgi:hypothetical protein
MSPRSEGKIYKHSRNLERAMGIEQNTRRFLNDFKGATGGRRERWESSYLPRRECSDLNRVVLTSLSPNQAHTIDRS